MQQQVQQRVHWIDTGKTFSIFLVVLLHFEPSLYIIKWHHSSGAYALWHNINLLLQPIRMPLFFLISGLLASRSIMHPDGTTLYRKLLCPLYGYGLWAILYMTFIPAYPKYESLNINCMEIIYRIIIADTPSWYLIALFYFYALSYITRNINIYITLLLFMILNIIYYIKIDHVAEQNFVQIYRCAIFYIAGVRMKDKINIYADHVNFTKISILSIIYIILLSLIIKYYKSNIIIDIIGAMIGVGLSVYLTDKLKNIRNYLKYISNNTLKIYLIHFLVVTAMSATMNHYAPSSVLNNKGLAIFYPVIGAICAVSLSLVVGMALQKYGFHWLFSPPRWLAPRPKQVRGSALS